MRTAIVSRLNRLAWRLGPCVVLATLGGCSGGSNSAAQKDVDVTAAAARAQADIANYAAASTVVHPAARQPTVSAAAADMMPEAAQKVVRTYFRMIARHDYAAARDLWVDDGRASGLDQPAFTAGYARFSRYDAQVGAPGSVSAGIGEVHVAVPVQVMATSSDGQPRRLRGTVMLQRTNDGIETSDVEDHLWRIESTSVDPSMPPAARPPQDRAQRR